ncbi:MAG TPA: hypothetical protein P5121_00440 [Caldilineaceae bacterium]|nr:hypothetical protein [Caldilineaceae bacterium]
MAKQKKSVRPRVARPSAQTTQYRRWGAVVVGILVVIGLAFWQLWDGDEQLPVTADLFPTPIGFPESALDVGTMQGESAPAFTLKDETGQLITVDPVKANQPIVLIFNMGLG